MNTQALMLEQEKKTQLQTTQAQLAALKRKWKKTSISSETTEEEKVGA